MYEEKPMWGAVRERQVLKNSERKTEVKEKTENKDVKKEKK